MLLFLLFANGIYDILCSIGILFDNSFLSQFHLNMFVTKNQTHLEKRLLAYWILTNGIIRLVSSFSTNLLLVAALTYYIEAFCFEYEYQVGNTLYLYKVRFVSITSVVFGLLLILSLINETWGKLLKTANAAHTTLIPITY